LEETITACVELRIPYLTLYAFSTENWQRPTEEVQLLMQLFTTTLQAKLPVFIKNDIKLMAIGDIDRLPTDCQSALQQAMDVTQHNKGLRLIVALSYSGRWDIVQAVKRVAQHVLSHQVAPHDIDTPLFQQYLSTHSLPDPDLLIRTGGDMRISNFFLWQLAYTELVILRKYWPEFRKEDLYKALIAYQQRERRFGSVN
jgi:undecaprenyl diphosphate synthase